MKSLNITVNMEESFTQTTVKLLRPSASSRSVATASTTTTASFTGVVSNGGAGGGVAMVVGVSKPSSSSLVKAVTSSDDVCDNGPSNGENDGDFHVTATIRIKPKSSSGTNAGITSIGNNSIVHNGAGSIKSETARGSSNSLSAKVCDEDEGNQQNNNTRKSSNDIGNSMFNGTCNNNNIKSCNDFSTASSISNDAGGSGGTNTSSNHSFQLEFNEEKPKDDDNDRMSYLQSGVGTKELSSSGSYRASKDYDLSYRLSSPSTGASSLPKSSYNSSYDVTDSVRGRKEGLCGLWNIGNTCFMNSIIQCLSHTRELTAFLRLQPSTERGTSKDQRILVEYTKLIKDMWSGTQRSVNPSELKYAFSSKHRMYSGSAQQDAQEFLRFFLDSLHGALNVAVKRDPLGELDDDMNNRVKADMLWDWYSKAENSMIKDLFVGQLRSTLKCTYCSTESTMFDPFWDLSLPLPSSNSRCKLENCLEMFIKEEILDGIDQPTCSKCNSRRKCTKSLTIERFPKYLVIHLKRFSETRWSKLTNVIEFPCGERGLNLQPYASEDNVGPAYYSLYGISNHMGSTAGGHYVAVCKHPKTKEWNEFNDNFVSETSERSLVTSSAYVLFYERA
ncbi:ubiquitin carboxyl-terminal hydrolase Usp2 isoform X1 [Anopheles coustani]|uniref:ubiquitin carboxyl-terminal hydrolase Usp2 isoform X1 n=1 Tax=Anopheles coustani TaxID=139045 RepID=UPI0026590978|nr:ubiquitin carboxyl-terminal hydrolase Usp2 isoform X1 [Anopheles coustani]